MVRRTLAALFAILVCLSASTVRAEFITITTGNATVQAYSSSGGTSSSHYDSLALPVNTAIEAVSGVSNSSAALDWSRVGNDTTFSFDFTQARSGVIYSSVETKGSIYFYANQNLTYTLSGFFDVADIGSGSGEANFQVSLVDYVGDELYSRPFVNGQYSNGTNNESFVLGEQGGDTMNSLSGNLTGELLAGHFYKFGFAARSTAYPDGDGGASTTGNVALVLTAVPEPTSVALFAGGLIGIVLFTLRRKR